MGFMNFRAYREYTFQGDLDLREALRAIAANAGFRAGVVSTKVSKPEGLRV